MGAVERLALCSQRDKHKLYHAMQERCPCIDEDEQEMRDWVELARRARIKRAVEEFYDDLER